MEISEDRVKLMRQRGIAASFRIYSGLFSFPNTIATAKAKAFQSWMEAAQTLDAHPDVPGKRPLSGPDRLPLAIQKSGLQWNILPEEQHFILEVLAWRRTARGARDLYGSLPDHEV